MVKIKSFCLFFIFIFLYNLSICAFSFRHIGMENGLSSRRVSEVVKDSEGFIWFFTHAGIDRYDGSEIRHYTLNDDDGLESKDRILSSTILTCDTEGTLWVSMRNGKIYFYNKFTDNFELRADASKIIAGTTSILNYILFDSQNRLWICINDSLYIYDPTKKSSLLICSFTGEEVTRLVQADDNIFYIGTSMHLYRLKENKTSLSFSIPEIIPLPAAVRIGALHAYQKKIYIGTFSNSVYIHDTQNNSVVSLTQEIPDVPIRCITSTNDNKILVGTDGSGLYSIQAEDNKLIERYMSDEDVNTSLSGNTVADIFVDEHNCIWVATSTNGVSILDPAYPQIKHIKHEYRNNNSLKSDHINIIYEDSDGDMWFGTNNGVSLYIPNENKWIHYLGTETEGDNLSPVILAISEDNNKNIWVGGYGTGIYCINKKNRQIQKLKNRTDKSVNGISTTFIYAIYVDGQYIWFGGIEGELTRYDTENDSYKYYPIECIGDIIQGDSNTLLIAACDGLACFNKTDKTVTWYKTLGDKNLRYPIRCLVKASTGTIWMATDGDGLISLDIKSGKSSNYTTTDGLSSNSINSVLEDEKGNIWFTTERDLYRLDLSNNVLTSMNEYLGIKWGYYTHNASLKKRNGELVFGTAEGAISFSPEFGATENNNFRLIFTEFRLDYRPVQAGQSGSPLKLAINKTESVSLSYMQNSFSISFSAINYGYSHQIEYRTKLEGFDNDWQVSGNNHTVGYTNLSSGQYRFRLQAFDKYTRTVISERDIAIFVKKPFWASWGAILVYILLASGIALFIVYYIRNKIEKQNTDEKINFFVNVAHDIQTPVTLIKAPLSELEEHAGLTDYGKKTLSVAIRNTDKLFSMVTQLLDFQKTDLAPDKLSVDLYDLNDYIQEKIAFFSIAASQKGIYLFFEQDKNSPKVWLDREKMDKIIDNILSNAIKYTMKGSVSVLLTSNQDKWHIEVKDTGIGIPSGQQKYLFRKFYRADNAVNSNESGSGIGLIFTRKLVRIHQGSITFSSIENQGTVFKLTFPISHKQGINVKIQQMVDPDTVQQEQPTSGTPGKETILLAEDDADMRKYLADSLSQEYTIYSAGSGEQALEQAKELNPDLIISDILMPGLRGDEMCRMLKSSMETSHIPVILLTALNEKENIISGLESGAEDYIIKPFDFSVLKARIRNILQNREKLRKMILSNETDMETVSYSNELDKEFLDKAIFIIEKELSNTEFSINEFCRELGMSRTSVYNKIKTLTDQGPNDFIRIIRLKKANELLKSQKYTILEVALMVGFSDSKYFSTSFKKQFGISPSKVK